jgi:hypothetical protein
MSVAGLLALSACEERPYPVRHSAPPPPAAPPADLMGAPSSPYTAYTAPPVYQQPAYAPPPVYTASPYDTGSVVAMAPIPNPGDPGSGPYYDARHYGGQRAHARYEAALPAQTADNMVTSPYGEGHPAPGRHPTYTYPAPMQTPASPVYVPPKVVTSSRTTTTTTTVAKSATYASKGPTAAPPSAAKTIEHKSAAVAVAAGAAAGLLARDAKHVALQAKQAATNAYAGKTNQPAPKPVIGPSGDRTTNLASLQTTLTDSVGKTAVLTAPSRFTANQPADVSLTLPPGFGDTLKGEAQKDGLADAAASVNMTALLSGDGFAVTPDDTQSATLTQGQPTEFHWTVTAQPGAKGPLHADVGADLLGGGSEKLALGSVQKAAGMGVKLTPRVVGASLLVLIAALIVAWLARGRGPTRSVAARRASRLAARGGRPLDMTSGSE